MLSTQVAFAAPDYTGDTLIVLSMRGGFDGLSAVVPYGDPDYAAARETLKVPQGELLAGTTDGYFGLHPSLAPLKPFWNAGTFGVVQACGLWAPDRSHFEAQAEMERAAPGTSARTGWLDRVVGVNGLTGSSFQAVQVGGSLPPESLLGPNPELALRSLDGFRLSGGTTPADRALWDAALRSMHADSPAALKQPSYTTLDAIETVANMGEASSYAPANGAVYDTGSNFAKSLRDIARMIKGGVGLQVACIDYGNWDMHSGLGALRPSGTTNGDYWFADDLLEFSEGLASFMTDLGSMMNDVTIVTLTEFGRRTQENDSAGVDHGYATAVMYAGGGVKGGSVKGTWPTLAKAASVDGDLNVTTDYRTVLREILSQRCRVSAADLSSIFPGLAVGLTGHHEGEGLTGREIGSGLAACWRIDQVGVVALAARYGGARNRGVVQGDEDFGPKGASEGQMDLRLGLCRTCKLIAVEVIDSTAISAGSLLMAADHSGWLPQRLDGHPHCRGGCLDVGIVGQRDVDDGEAVSLAEVGHALDRPVWDVPNASTGVP